MDIIDIFNSAKAQTTSKLAKGEKKSNNKKRSLVWLIIYTDARMKWEIQLFSNSISLFFIIYKINHGTVFPNMAHWDILWSYVKRCWPVQSSS